MNIMQLVMTVVDNDSDEGFTLKDTIHLHGIDISTKGDTLSISYDDNVFSLDEEGTMGIYRLMMGAVLYAVIGKAKKDDSMVESLIKLGDSFSSLNQYNTRVVYSRIRSNNVKSGVNLASAFLSIVNGVDQFDPFSEEVATDIRAYLRDR